MEITKQQIIHTDVLIIGGGTAGCYAALTIREKSDAKIVIAEKANIKRSGCLAAGVNAINAYIVKGRKLMMCTAMDFISLRFQKVLQNRS